LSEKQASNVKPNPQHNKDPLIRDGNYNPENPQIAPRVFLFTRKISRKFHLQFRGVIPLTKAQTDPIA